MGKQHTPVECFCRRKFCFILKGSISFYLIHLFVLLNRDNDKDRINSLQFFTIGLSGLVLICINTHMDSYIKLYAHLYAYLCRMIKRKKEVKKFDTFQLILHSVPGSTWPAPALFPELWPGAIPHLSAPWLFLKSS